MIGYSYLLTNSGQCDAGGAVHGDGRQGEDVTCPPTASLAPGASMTCTASYTIKQEDLDAGKVTNTAAGHASFKGTPVNSSLASKTVNGVQQAGWG